MSVYALDAIMKKRLKIEASLYTMLQVYVTGRENNVTHHAKTRHVWNMREVGQGDMDYS